MINLNYGDNGILCFDRLWDLMHKKQLKKTDLRKAGIHSNTISKLSKNENVTAEVICSLCKILDCQPEDILEYKKPS